MLERIAKRRSRAVSSFSLLGYISFMLSLALFLHVKYYASPIRKVDIFYLESCLTFSLIPKSTSNILAFRRIIMAIQAPNII